MKTQREKKLEVALLKEKLERISGKKVLFKESASKINWFNADWGFSEPDVVEFSPEDESIQFSVPIKEFKKITKGAQTNVRDENNVAYQISKKEAQEILDSYEENWSDID